jgi:phage/plasmid-like protein (TIGR03299 family)
MHGVEIINGKGQMFSGEDITPWHGLGTVIPGLATAEEALIHAGLDWEVEMIQATKMWNGEVVPIPGRFSTTRMTDGKDLGIVSNDYHVYNNLEAFQFLNKITDTNDAEAVFTTAGSLFGGSRTFMVMKLTEGFTVGDNDAHDLYLMATNSHDGNQAFSVTVTPIRAVCNNTVTLALAQAKTKWSIRHKIALKDQAAKARDILQLGYTYEDAFEKEVAKLMEIEVTKDKFYSVVDKIVPASAVQHAITVEEIMNIWETEDTVRMGGGEDNAWGAFNAITFFTDHKEYKTPISKFNSVIGTGTGQGFGEALRPKAHKALLALV